MVAQGFTIDLNKPLVFQVGHLGETYQEWVQQPIMGKECPRFFESHFLEFFTRTEWWVVPLVWLPVIGWSLYTSIAMGHSIPQVVLIVTICICAWTLVEYTLHRFILHMKTKSYWGNTFHYLFHGCHHKHPLDNLRLAFPPVVTATVCVPVWNIIKVMSTPSITPAIFGGFLLGYVIYDVNHYYLHYGHPTSQFPKALKKHHLNHHFRLQNKGFGISLSLWDKAFGS